MFILSVITFYRDEELVVGVIIDLRDSLFLCSVEKHPTHRIIYKKALHTSHVTSCHVSRSLPATQLTTCLRTQAAASLHAPHLGARSVCSPRQVPAPLWPGVSMSRRKRSGLLAAGGAPGYVTSS